MGFRLLHHINADDGDEELQCLTGVNNTNYACVTGINNTSKARPTCVADTNQKYDHKRNFYCYHRARTLYAN
jgi:hypothetical protein